MTVIVKHNKTNSITDWTQAQLDEQIALGNFAPGTTLANIVLPSDWNNDHTLTGVGTMAEQDATAVAITGGTINNTTIGATTATTGRFTSVTTPSVTATTTDLTLSAISTGAVNLATAGGTQFQIANTASTTNYLATTGSNGGTPALYSAGASTNIGTNIVSKGTGSVAFYTNGGVVQQVVSHTASAVNYVQVTGAATGGQPTISAQGSDAAVDLTLNTKSTGTLRLQSNSTTRVSVNSGGTVALGISASGGSGLQVIATGSQVNFATVLGSITGQIPTFSMANSSDTNVGLGIVTKGTGAIDLAAGSSGVNISNGGTVTAITRTVAGSNYTTAPTVAISAPTTAGGVQATATSRLIIYGVTVANGGTGYTVGNTLTLVGGTLVTTASTYTVSAVSGGVVTAVTYANYGNYSAIPTSPAATTGGTGTGCTLNLTGVGISDTFTITNAGSGYIEQPTVTFSGGGGSGAAAYATVGSVPIVKTIASALSFTTPSSEVFRIVDANSTGQNYISLESSGGGSNFRNAGAGTNLSTYFISKGTGTISFATNASTSTEQMRVSHTASAVNFVQVTGGATGSGPTISAQGSDGNAFLAITSKGTSAIRLQTGGSSQVLINNTTSAINQLGLAGSTTGQACSIITQGTDTDIDLALTPKGTGRVQFGTRTASADVAITGYIEIKDAGGTVRRLAVVG
jgi:hypothetical protein